MNTKKRPFLFLLSVLLVLSLACSSVAELSATATPLPTSTFTPTPPPTSTPTPAGPVASDGSTLVTKFGDLELSNELYEHPNGWVSFYPMKGWEIEVNDFSVTMYEPSSNVNFYITATNTGYTLNEEAYANFRNNMEELYFFQDQYEEINSGGNEAINLYFVEKRYLGSDGSTKLYAVSIYQQFDEIIYTIEMVGNEEFATGDADNPYRVMFNSFTQTIETDNSVAATLPLYQYSWSYTSPTTNASISVPWAWSFFIDQSEGFQYANFYSPDFAAYAQFVQQDTVKLTKELGLDFAISYLNIVHSNGSNDVQINQFGELEELEEGLYFFDWESKDAGKAGLLKYDIRIPNKLIMVLTIVQDQDLLPLYANLLGEISGSYQLGQ